SSGCFLGQILDVTCFGGGQSGTAQFRNGGAQNRPGGETTAYYGDGTLEDGPGGSAIKLLVDDGARQCFKTGLAILHAIRPDALDDPPQNGVSVFQVDDGVFHGWGALGSGI